MRECWISFGNDIIRIAAGLIKLVYYALLSVFQNIIIAISIAAELIYYNPYSRNEIIDYSKLQKEKKKSGPD